MYSGVSSLYRRVGYLFVSPFVLWLKCCRVLIVLVVAVLTEVLDGSIEGKCFDEMYRPANTEEFFKLQICFECLELNRLQLEKEIINKYCPKWVLY